MDLNELLRTCDYGDVRARAMLLDALHEAGRLEEEALLAEAGTPVRWAVCSRDTSLLTGELPEGRGGTRCPFCGGGHYADGLGTCEHSVAATDRSNATTLGYLHLAVAEMPDDLAHTVWFLLWKAAIDGCSPVATRQNSEDSEDGWEQVHHCWEVFYVDAEGRAVEDGEVEMNEDGTEEETELSEAEIVVVYAPDPAAYIQRVVDLIRQRTAAGCPVHAPKAFGYIPLDGSNAGPLRFHGPEVA